VAPGFTSRIFTRLGGAKSDHGASTRAADTAIFFGDSTA
jgi:hypothetical protein